jgi:sulfite exporter TauE/SafE
MDVLLAHCVAAFSQNGALFTVFFLAGLTGGFTHCLSMCGPIVASEAAACGASCSGKACGKNTKIANATQLSYHLGRAMTYGALGFSAALFSRQIEASPLWPWLSAFMLLIAGTMFVISSLPGCRHTFFKPSSKLTFVRGALLGFLPCGLLYAALMMAATTANPLRGMVAMWVFVLGTIPALLIASVGTSVIALKWQTVLQKAGRILMLFNGLSLFVMASKLVRI